MDTFEIINQRISKVANDSKSSESRVERSVYNITKKFEDYEFLFKQNEGKMSTLVSVRIILIF